MEQQNLTSRVREFLLVGLTQNLALQRFLFVVFFIVYMMTWLGNLTIIITVITDHQLHTPMYFLLGNLAFIDLSESSVTVPKMLWDLLSKQETITFGGCMSQMFFFHFTGGAVVFFLMVMALDRYVAIHKPLHYLSIMNKGVCVGLVVGAWLGGFAHSIVQVALTIQLPFCGPNTLDNFYCDVPQVIKLACTDTYMVELLMVSNSGLLTSIIFIILIVSYTVILVKIRTHVPEGKHKALSTCGAQVVVVSIHFMPCIFIYALPFRKFSMDKAVSALYTVITPMLNPMIYTLRNTEMKNAIKRLMNRVFSCRKPNM
ncbi:olfactory receptor 4D1-like [Terrapene carolina triunguis]|uniref:olfactory receptor 4D1-like n=1 Tax=Terrapene triunguis TaxID=2587831 RepID=UPI000CEFE367|nr:olfactory receptor 4D1-like [Terrapene carolina triunguis]